MKKTIFVDTNYILRLFLGDISSQFKKALRLFEKIEKRETVGIITILAINELIWVLENFYYKKRRTFIPQILKLISLKNIKIFEIKKKELIQILDKMTDANLDFTDEYQIFFCEKSKKKIASFDKKLLKNLKAS